MDDKQKRNKLKTKSITFGLTIIMSVIIFIFGLYGISKEVTDNAWGEEINETSDKEKNSLAAKEEQQGSDELYNTLAVYDVSVNYENSPVGIDTESPVFGWKLRFESEGTSDNISITESEGTSDNISITESEGTSDNISITESEVISENISTSESDSMSKSESTSENERIAQDIEVSPVQELYHIQVWEKSIPKQEKKQVWDSGEIESSLIKDIEYKGDKLKDNTDYEFVVTITDNQGKTSSKEGFFSTAFIEKSPFEDALMLSMQPEEDVYYEGQAVFVKNFETKKDCKVARATLYATALGIYDIWINGRCADDAFFKPGWTDYNHTLLYKALDVTEIINNGSNNGIATMLGTGWWCGRNAKGTYDFNKPGFICRLILQYEDGSKQEILTDESWRYFKDTNIRSADFYNGECADLTRISAKQLSETSTQMQETPKNVVINTDFNGIYKSYYGKGVTADAELLEEDPSYVLYLTESENREKAPYGEVEVIKEYEKMPSSITLNPGETLLVDIKQNISGVPHIECEAGQKSTLHIQVAERLNDTGDAEHGNDGPKGSLYRLNYRSALTETILTIPENTKVEYHPTFFFAGFQYMAVTTDQPVTIYNLAAIPVTYAAERAGNIQTNNDDINQLFQNITWSHRNNFQLVATDCPQRDERLGWTGDLAAFSKTSMYNQSLYDFYRKWTQDLIDSQTSEGAFTDTVPSTIVTGSGNSGWADAGISIPLEIYEQYGDIKLLGDTYPYMQKYMDYLEGISDFNPANKRMGAYALYGDWLADQNSDKELISALWYAKDAKNMQRIAAILSDKEGEKKYKKLYSKISKYIDKAIRNNVYEQNYENATVTEICFLLELDLCSDRKKKQLLTELENQLKENDYHLLTGFVGTPLLLHVLSENDRSDLAYRILLCEENPSWLYCVRQGATTIWERFDSYTTEKGFSDAGMNSFDHFIDGSAARWMYEDMLGIRVDLSGEKPITISPKIPKQEDISISQCSGFYDSVYGRVDVSWSKNTAEHSVELHITVPPTISAELSVPYTDIKPRTLKGGSYVIWGHMKD